MTKNLVKYDFNNISLLITHYNRSESLARLLEAFSVFGCIFNQVVVSDDSSQDDHRERLEALQKEFNFELITSGSNKGLGNNINKCFEILGAQYLSDHSFLYETTCDTPPGRNSDSSIGGLKAFINFIFDLTGRNF